MLPSNDKILFQDFILAFLLFTSPLYSCGMDELRHVIYLLGKLPHRCGLNESFLGGICHLTC
ncbi:hypothetical protein NC651_003770 [Populus alba x Populus x berolinensis]|nr:hypothetical protein NC651_003770 [Populus alba x Populus x berolinensis]